jgi:hypothetical protein
MLLKMLNGLICLANGIDGCFDLQSWFLPTLYRSRRYRGPTALSASCAQDSSNSSRQLPNQLRCFASLACLAWLLLGLVDPQREEFRAARSFVRQERELR